MPNNSRALVSSIPWRPLNDVDIERRDGVDEFIEPPDIAMTFEFVSIDRALFRGRRRMKRHDDDDGPGGGRATNDVDRLGAFQMFQDVAENEGVSGILPILDPTEIDATDRVVSIGKTEPREVRRMNLDRDPGKVIYREAGRPMDPEPGARAQVDDAADPDYRILVR